MEIQTASVSMTVISYKEVEKILAWFFNVPVVESFVGSMDSDDGNWGNDTVHRVTVKPEAMWIRSNHEKALADARARGHVAWTWELAAVLDEAGKAGLVPMGPMLIEVSW